MQPLEEVAVVYGHCHIGMTFGEITSVMLPRRKTEAISGWFNTRRAEALAGVLGVVYWAGRRIHATAPRPRTTVRAAVMDSDEEEEEEDEEYTPLMASNASVMRRTRSTRPRPNAAAGSTTTPRSRPPRPHPCWMSWQPPPRMPRPAMRTRASSTPFAASLPKPRLASPPFKPKSPNFAASTRNN